MYCYLPPIGPSCPNSLQGFPKSASVLHPRRGVRAIRVTKRAGGDGKHHVRFCVQLDKAASQICNLQSQPHANTDVLPRHPSTAAYCPRLTRSSGVCTTGCTPDRPWADSSGFALPFRIVPEPQEYCSPKQANSRRSSADRSMQITTSRAFRHSSVLLSFSYSHHLPSLLFIAINPIPLLLP